jgi:hypothetical protein
MGALLCRCEPCRYTPLIHDTRCDASVDRLYACRIVTRRCASHLKPQPEERRVIHRSMVNERWRHPVTAFNVATVRTPQLSGRGPSARFIPSGAT